MAWFKWFLALILGLFVYFAVGTLFSHIVTGTTSSDVIVQNVVPLVFGLVVAVIPVFAITK